MYQHPQPYVPQPVLYPYVNTKPGHYPVEDLNTQYCWKALALEVEALEEEEWSRQCAYEEDLARQDFFDLGLGDSQMEWYQHEHAA